MKLEIILFFILISLFNNNVYAESSGAASCKAAMEKGDITTALFQADKALATYKKDRDAYICQGRALAAKDDLNGALASLKQAHTLSVDALDKAITSMLLGNVYKALKQYDDAITSYNTATTQAIAANVKAYERASYIAIGNVHIINQQNEQALAQYQLASKLSANDNERGEAYEKIALAYHNLKQHDAAVEYQLKGYLMQEKVGTLDEYAHAGIALGRYYELAENHSSAENILNKILKLAKDQGGAYYEAIASCVLARVKTAEGNKEAANSLISRAKTIASNANDKDLESEITQETQGL